MSGQEPIEIRIELPARLDMLRPLNAFVKELLGPSNLDLSRKPLDDIALAIHEAFTNVCVHAYSGVSNGKVVVRIVLSPDQIALFFEDEGTPFDHENWKEPDLDNMFESGRGSG